MKISQIYQIVFQLTKLGSNVCNYLIQIGTLHFLLQCLYRTRSPMIDELEKVPFIKFKALDFDTTTSSENVFDEEN